MKQTFTRSIMLFFILLTGMNSSYAQMNPKTEKGGTPANYMVKINLLALPLDNFSFQFERAIGEKTALGLGVRFMPKSGLPFQSGIESLINDPESWDQIKSFKTGNLAISPEVRFYLGKGVFHGFYVAPFARYTNYSADLPVNFDVPDQTGNTTTEMIPLSGDLTTITGGLLVGAQWKISQLIYIDWSILGPQYGISNGDISGKRSLTTDEQEALRDELQNLEDLPFVNTKYTVDGNGAKVDFKGPWAGIRSSFCLGFRF